MCFWKHKWSVVRGKRSTRSSMIRICLLSLVLYITPQCRRFVFLSWKVSWFSDSGDASSCIAHDDSSSVKCMKFHSNRRVLKLDIIRPKVHLSQHFIWENVSSYFYEQKRRRRRIPGVQKLVTGRTSCRTTARFTTRVQPCLATNIGCCKSRLHEYWILIG